MSEAVGRLFAVVNDPRIPSWAGHFLHLGADFAANYDLVYMRVKLLADTQIKRTETAEVKQLWRELQVQYEIFAKDVDVIRRTARALLPIHEGLIRRAAFEQEVVEVGAAEAIASGTLRLTGGKKQRDKVRVWLDREDGEVYLGRLKQSAADELVALIDHATQQGEDRGVLLYNKKVKAVQEGLPLVAHLIRRIKGSTANAKALYAADEELARPLRDDRK